MDDFMQWALNSLDQHQQQHAAAPPPAYGGSGDSGGAGPAAFLFPSLQALQCQSTTAVGGVRDLTVQVDQHLAASSWSASSGDSPGAAVMEHDATAVAGWSPHTARATTSRPVSWNFSAAASAQTTTDASLVSPASASGASGRGGRPSTPGAGRRAGLPVLAAPTASHGQGAGGGGTTAASSSASAGGPVQDHIIAERRRREKINQRFIELSTVIPGLKKVLRLPPSSSLPFHASSSPSC